MLFLKKIGPCESFLTAKTTALEKYDGSLTERSLFFLTVLVFTKSRPAIAKTSYDS